MNVRFVYPTLVQGTAEGITVNILELQRSLQALGVSVSLEAPKLRLAQLNRKGVHLTHGLRALSHLRQAFSDPDVDVVHFHAALPSQSLLPLIARWLRPGSRQPVIGQLWNTFVDGADLAFCESARERVAHRVFNSARLARLGLGALSPIVVSSSYQEEQLRGAGYRGPIHRIPNGVDLARFHPPAAGEKEHQRASFQLPSAGPLVLYYGHLTPWKGVPQLVRAFARALPTCPDAWLVIAHTEYGRNAPALQKEIRRLGIRDRVRFLGTVDAAALARAADLAVLPAIGTVGTAVYPNVLLEWMASGLPVVASGLPTVREVVEDGVNGIIAPPGDPERLAEALVRLLRDEKQRDALGREARSTAETRFSWQVAGARLKAVYEDLLA